MTSTIVKSLAVSRNGGNERPLFDLQRLKPATARPPGWGGHWHGGGWGGGGPGYWGAGLIGLGVGAAVGRCRGVRDSGRTPAWYTLLRPALPQLQFAYRLLHRL